MIRAILIRHGMTDGNRAHRYIGRTDEPLCQEGKVLLQKQIYPLADRVICSPMLRCRETASIIYPQQIPQLVEDLRECDFGDFEGKNFEELAENHAYSAWVNSSCAATIPNGENPEAFMTRCADAFLDVMRFAEEETIAFVVHGGTIMAILSRLAQPQRRFYDYHVPNGGGYCVEYDGVSLHITERL